MEQFKKGDLVSIKDTSMIKMVVGKTSHSYSNTKGELSHLLTCYYLDRDNNLHGFDIHPSCLVKISDTEDFSNDINEGDKVKLKSNFLEKHHSFTVNSVNGENAECFDFNTNFSINYYHIPLVCLEKL